jgi:dienelactone hydrolase
MDAMSAKRLVVLCAFLALSLAQAALGAGPRNVSYAIRGVSQTFYFFDPQSHGPGASAVIVVSGDGGWHGFIVEIAQYLADHGYAAIGVDAKEYLSMMSKPKALDPAQVSGDFAAIAQFAKQQTGAKSLVLVGWSEGAGLAVLGGLDPTLRGDLRGVVAIGLPELNELAWRWSDSVIYVTKKVPNEPTFNSKDYLGKLAPVPLMSIQSTQDDFVPAEVAREVFARAQEPKQIIFIGARNHRFEGERPAFWQALDRALAWFETLAAKSPH